MKERHAPRRSDLPAKRRPNSRRRTTVRSSRSPKRTAVQDDKFGDQGLPPIPGDNGSERTGPGKLPMFGVREIAQNRPQIVKILAVK